MQKSLIDLFGRSDLDPKTSHSQSIGVSIYSLTQPGLLVIVIPVLQKVVVGDFYLTNTSLYTPRNSVSPFSRLSTVVGQLFRAFWSMY